MIHTTVIIPSLHSPWIHLVLDALRRQEYDLTGAEVIVVGQDRYGLVREDALVRFVRTPQPTPPARARNIGIAAARGAILCFLDADCIAAPDWLAKLTARYRDPAVQVVGGVITFPQDYWTVADTLAHFSGVVHGAARREHGHLPSLNLSVRRTLFAQVGGFDEAFQRPSGEDTELTKRMVQRGVKLWLAEDAVIFHIPQRAGCMDVARRAYHHGQAAAVPAFRAQLQAESWLFGWLPLMVTAVPRAAAVTWQIFASTPALRRYWRVVPAVFALKLIWALSAADALRRAGSK